MTVYGYARVSTRKQVEGNSLEQQVQQLKESGAQVIFEEDFTGTKIDRPQFSLLLGHLQKGDTLMVCKIDRFARSMNEGSKLVQELINKGVRVHILNIGVLDNTPASNLVKNIFFAFAEFERDMIIERTQQGKAIARTKPGFKDGRPKKYSEKKMKNILRMLSVNGGAYSYNQVAEMTGVGRATLFRCQKEYVNNL